MVGRIQQHVERLMRSRAEVFEGANRKRALVEQADSDAKRQRTATVSTQPILQITPLTAGPHTLAEVFTLTQNDGLKSFNVAAAVPASLAAKISVTTISRLDAGILEQAISVRLPLFYKLSLYLTIGLGCTRPFSCSSRGCTGASQPGNSSLRRGRG